MAKSETLLSNVSLGIDTPEKTGELKAYRRNGFHVKRLERPIKASRRYSEVVVKPKLGWYPSKTSNFTFGVELDPDWIMRKIVPSFYNPSVWLHERKRLLTLRVPKDRGKETYNRLYKRGFWYHTIRREWFLRRGKRQ